MKRAIFGKDGKGFNVEVIRAGRTGRFMRITQLEKERTGKVRSVAVVHVDQSLFCDFARAMLDVFSVDACEKAGLDVTHALAALTPEDAGPLADATSDKAPKKAKKAKQ